MIPHVDLDFGLLALGNYEDVIAVFKFVDKHMEIRVYTKHGTSYLSKCVIVKLEIPNACGNSKNYYSQ